MNDYDPSTDPVVLFYECLRAIIRLWPVTYVIVKLLTLTHGPSS